jgi:hypothetical protein
MGREDGAVMTVCKRVVGGLVMMSATLAAVCPQTAEANVVEHLDLAEMLVATVLPAVNFYGDPTKITWEGFNGLDYSTNRSKCATLVTQLFERAYDPDYVAWFGCTSPHAASYHDKIEVEDGFTLIESIHDVQPGDIIAIEYIDAGCTNLTCGTFSSCTSTGHVAIVADFPKARTASAPLVAGTLQFSVDIIDTSTSYHGTADTRYMSDAGGAHDQGVGQGTMRLYVNGKDATHPIVGHSWSTSSGSAFFSNAKRDVVIGRYNG